MKKVTTLSLEEENKEVGKRKGLEAGVLMQAWHRVVRNCKSGGRVSASSTPVRVRIISPVEFLKRRKGHSGYGRGGEYMPENCLLRVVLGHFGKRDLRSRDVRCGPIRLRERGKSFQTVAEAE